MSMPNGVPQSPTWFWRTTSWPSASRMRARRVADDRRAQVADVHLLRDVRGRVVDDHRVALRGKRHAEPRVAGERERLALEKVARERDVDEAGARDLDALADALQVELRDDRRGDLARRPLERLAEAHREIGLVVGALGAADHRIDARAVGAEFGYDGIAEPLGQDVPRVCHLSFARWKGANYTVSRRGARMRVDEPGPARQAHLKNRLVRATKNPRLGSVKSRSIGSCTRTTLRVRSPPCERGPHWFEPIVSTCKEKARSLGTSIPDANRYDWARLQ